VPSGKIRGRDENGTHIFNKFELTWQRLCHDFNRFCTRILGSDSALENLKAGCAHSDWFVEAKFENGNITAGALGAEQAPAVSAAKLHNRSATKFFKINIIKKKRQPKNLVQPTVSFYIN
jgi:hypothetical protein